MMESWQSYQTATLLPDGKVRAAGGDRGIGLGPLASDERLRPG
jgi:hypothetical protein